MARERNQRSALKREREIERELGAIMRELDRRLPMENPRPKKPEKSVQLPRAPPLQLDLEE